MRGRCAGLAAIRARGGRGGKLEAARVGRPATWWRKTALGVRHAAGRLAETEHRLLRLRRQEQAAVMVHLRARGGGVRSSTGWRVV